MKSLLIVAMSLLMAWPAMASEPQQCNGGQCSVRASPEGGGCTGGQCGGRHRVRLLHRR